MQSVAPIPPPTDDHAGRLARARIGLIYWWRFGRFPNLADATRFTELVQVRKLADRDPRMPVLSDKLAVKAIVAQTLGAEWVTPTSWSGDALPRDPPVAGPFVLKSRHGCNQVAFVRDASVDWAALAGKAAQWVRRPYGEWLDEWAYRMIPRGLMIEPFIGREGVLPLDYKFFVFDGRVEFVQVHLDREYDHRWIVLTRDWRPVADGNVIPKRPAALATMIAGAETLGAEFDFVRVDLYEVEGRPRFGEMSFYPGSGLDPFDPPELDLAMGRLWLAAKRALAAPQYPAVEAQEA